MADRLVFPDEREASRLCDRIFGRDGLRARATDRPTSFLVEVDGEALVLKVARADRAASPSVEAWAYDLCTRHGIKVPEVLMIVDEPEAFVARMLPGAPLSDDRTSGFAPAAWRAAGEDLRAMHEITIDGFGPIVRKPNRFVGEASTWSPVIDYARERGIDELVRMGLIAAQDGARLLRRYDDIDDYLTSASSATGRLLNGDVWSGHLFVDEAGSYTGMIDFDQAQAGDPLWDLARIPLWDEDEALDWVLEGYGADVLGPDERELVLPLYLLAFCVHHIVRFPFSVDPRFPRVLLRQCRYERVL